MLVLRDKIHNLIGQLDQFKSLVTNYQLIILAHLDMKYNGSLGAKLKLSVITTRI